MMMMTGMMKLDDNMSNLTSASNEASEVNCTNLYPHGQLPFAISPNQPPLAKKKRNLPGNPDPEAEVVALSPKTLIATNRFMCEICKKGFQRDQNLQLHRRGHNLPWKLKQRSNKEVMRKKVYVCPEVTCVHHDPSRALGDLTGIKKHFFRKHGEKKWKCEKCSKKYAVQSDWKTHSKVCGTREYRCDCGTLFSRRDSFITHRAFCDALAQETASKDKSQYYFNPQNHQLHNFPLKPEPQDPHPQLGFNPIRPHLPPWLTTPNPNPLDLSTQVFYSPSLDHLDHPSFHNPHDQKNPSPPNSLLPSFQPTPPPPPHMSATALLQKAAQMGAVTRGKLSSTSETILTAGPHQADHVSTSSITAPPAETETTAGSSAGLGFGSRDQERGGGSGFLLSSHECMEQVGATMMMGSLSSTCGGGFGGPSSSSFEEALNGMFSNKMSGGGGGGGVGGGSRGGGDGLTRDFLGLRAFSHGGFPNMAGFDQMNSSSSNSYDKLSQNQIPPWQG